MNPVKQFDCITVGDLFLDIVLSGFPSPPRLGEEIFAEALQREAGGGAAITAAGLARLGLRSATLGMVGQSDGQWLIERLRECGVDTGLLHIHVTEPTGLTVAASTARDRAFLTYNGANQFLKEVLSDRRTHDLMLRARHVHLATPIAPALLRTLASTLHAAGSTISIDVGWRRQWLEDEQCLEALADVDLFFPNAREAELMTGQSDPQAMLQSFSAGGLSRVALKLGPRGSMLLWDREIIERPAHPVTAVDTTGAGDCFDAGFLYGLLEGLSPERCLEIANYCGALSTEALGGIASFPKRDKIIK
jgi:sugar/nucleoside kinase (ribokinase family)